VTEGAPAVRSPRRRVVEWIALAAIVAALAAAADGLVRLNTWYLASDQFAFLTFARDLRRGTVFHDDPTFTLVARKSPFRVDALAQTYFWRDGRLFSRYPPGFPALLAAAGWLGGETGEHLLNPALFLVVMLVIAATPLVLLPDRAVGAAAGAASVWLLLLLPTDIHLWGITVARDLPAHLFGLLAVLAAARGRFVASGLILGLASVIRPDAVLYGASIAAVAALVRPPFVRALAASLAYFVGAAPLFAYNWITEGHPLSFTQGGEFTELLGSIEATGAVAVAQTVAFASGGAFRLSNLAQSLPGNVAHLTSGFGWMLVPAFVAAAWAAVRSRLYLAALAPYPLLALVFYSFWSHPDARYLAGVALCLMPFAGLGLVLLAERAVAADAGRAWLAGVLVFAVLAALARLGVLPGWVPRPSTIVWTSAVAIAAVALAARLAGARRSGLAPVAAIAPPVVLAIVGLVNLASGGQRRDPFQRPQVERARAALGAVVPPGSLVITDSALGRPAENIAHYTGIRAMYGSELDLLDTIPTAAVMQNRLSGHRVFYLLDARDRYSLGLLREDTVTHRLVERREGMALLEWFVNPIEASAGAALYEVELKDEWRRRIDDLIEAGMMEPYPAYEGKRAGSAPP
jgi:hypothetical protein